MIALLKPRQSNGGTAFAPAGEDLTGEYQGEGRHAGLLLQIGPVGLATALVSPQVTATQDVMELRARLFAIALGIAVLLFVVNLVRTRKLKEEFALLWLLMAVVLVLVPVFIDYLDMVAHALGIEYPPALIFVLAIISLLLVLFQFSIRISRFSEQIKVLTQELALQQARVESLERSAAPSDRHQDAPPCDAGDEKEDSYADSDNDQT